MYDWYPMNTGPSITTQHTANQSIVGTCSCCGGPVCVPTAYHSIVPPVPTCQRCGATKQPDYGPVIHMVPPKGKMVGTWPHVEWQVKKEDLPTSLMPRLTKSLLSGKWTDTYGNEWSSDFDTNKS